MLGPLCIKLGYGRWIIVGLRKVWTIYRSPAGPQGVTWRQNGTPVNIQIERSKSHLFIHSPKIPSSKPSLGTYIPLLHHTLSPSYPNPYSPSRCTQGHNRGHRLIYREQCTLICRSHSQCFSHATPSRGCGRQVITLNTCVLSVLTLACESAPCEPPEFSELERDDCECELECEDVDEEGG